MTTSRHILKIDASARKDGSYSRKLSDALVKALLNRTPDASVAVRDLADSPPAFVTEDLGQGELHAGG